MDFCDNLSNCFIVHCLPVNTNHIVKNRLYTTGVCLQEDGVNLNGIDAVILRLIGHPQSGWIDLKKENLTRIEYLYKLTTAKAATHTITLIPGETTVIFLEQIAQQLNLDSTKLKEAYANTADMSEGLLVPDTYSIPKSINEERLIDYLLKESLEKHKKLSNRLLGSYDESKWLQLVTLASVIQKEAASLEDMPMVSSVIHNRLKKNMRLQMDGTLNYGKHSHQKVTAAQIRSDQTSYNTYKHRGLPDVPVCNVSFEALNAAINPKHTDYLYFVRGKNGEHIYSSYFSTHHKNILNATK